MNLEQFMAICMLMSVVQLRSASHYWNADLGNTLIAATRACNWWEEIRRYLHFVDDSTIDSRECPGFDPLNKIPPMLSGIRDRCLTIPIDEQIILTKTKT